MDPLCLRIDVFEESTDVGSEEFACVSMCQDISTYFVVFGEHSKRFFVDAPASFCFLQWFDSHGLEEEFLELERGGEIDDSVTSLLGYF